MCNRCYDVPQNQLRAIAIPQDPVPVQFPLVEPFLQDETHNTPPYGVPDGLDYNAVMPYNGALKKPYGVPLALLSVTADGTTTVSVTCSAPHNLVNGDVTADQIAVEGLSVNAADGFYTVNVTSATAFTYTTFGNILPGSLLTSTTRMITCYVGLPLGVTTIQQLSNNPGGLPFATWDSSLWNESIWY